MNDEREEFADAPITEVTRVEVEDRAGTVPRCVRCGRLVKIGGDAARPTFEEMETNAPDECYRSMSSAWTWCSGRLPWTLTLTGHR